MTSGAVPTPSAAYLLNLAAQHASARGYQFDEQGRSEFSQIADQGLETAHQAGIFEIEDIMRDVAPNTILLTDSIIKFADGNVLTWSAVQQGLLGICPLFPFC
jgi:hypothetical protein